MTIPSELPETLAGFLTEEPDGTRTWEAQGPKRFGLLTVRFLQKSGKYFAELRAPKRKVSLDFGPLDEFRDLLIQVENHLLIEYPWAWSIFRPRP